MPILKAVTLMKNKRKKNLNVSINATTHRSGFTFIEVIMALAIVSIALVALLQLHLVSIRMADTSRIRSQAILLAREKIDEKLAAGFPQPSTNSGTEYINSLDLKWTTEVTQADPPNINGIRINDLRKISVNVRWNQGSGQKEVKLSTLVTNRNL